jgi:hypothetical protein
VIVTQLLKKLPTFYETQQFITLFTTAFLPVPVLSQMNKISVSVEMFGEGRQRKNGGREGRE